MELITDMGHLVFVNDDGELELENEDGRTTTDDPLAERLELQMPDGRWLPYADGEIIDAYWP